jgi:putative membrane protein
MDSSADTGLPRSHADPLVTGAVERLPVSRLPGVAAVGFAMGSADIVPGVSGGTVALVLGVYDRLVGSIRQGTRGLSALLRGRPREAVAALRAVDWGFLLSLALGIGAAIVLLAGILGTLLEEQPVLMSALFLGLVAGSVVVAADEVRDPGPQTWLVGAVTAVLTFLLLGLRAGTLDEPSALVLVAGGALAICAMILPGVSGSFLLLLVGLYEVVLAAVDERDLVTVGLVAVGAVVGLAAFSTLLHWLLDRHRDPVMAVLLGLMVGSLRVLWPWPAGEEGVGDTRLGAPDGQVLEAALLAVGAAAVVAVVARIARRHDVHVASTPGPG